MLKTLLLIVVALFCGLDLCHAQIGATKAELARRYGKPSPNDKMLTAQYDNLVDDYFTFQHGKMKVYAGFKEGRAVLLMIQKSDKSPMGKDEVFAILGSAAKKPDWILLSDNAPNPRWKLRDSTAYAYYYPEADTDGAPGRFVRIQTAALDEVYTKLRHTDLIPTDPKTPLFRIFEPTPVQGDHPKATYDDDKPLLTVYYVRDLVLASDDKGVMLGLNDKDTTAFAELTRKFKGRYLILKATDDAMEVMHITAPIEDGYLEFRAPEEAAIAEYFRKRFKIAEFK